MKTLTLLSTLMLAFSAQAHAKLEWKSIYTNTKTDCVIVQEATDKAPIDFATLECKAFGGYKLEITGGDIRYSPALYFGGKEIRLEQPEGFHDMGSDKIEWVYTSNMDDEGMGTLEWKGLIYRIQMSHGDAEESFTGLYVVRLAGEKSCPLGRVKTNEAARALVKNAAAPCVKFDE